MAHPQEKNEHQATELIKRFDELTQYPIKGEEYLPVEDFSLQMQEELMNVIKDPFFDRYHVYHTSCACGCGVTKDPQDNFKYASIRPEALDFLRNEGFYDGEEDFLMNSFYKLIQMTGVYNIEGQSEKIYFLIDYMWDWMCSIDEKLILDYVHPQYKTSMLHSILYGHHTEKMTKLTDRFLDLWDKHYPVWPLPEAENWCEPLEGEDPRTIEYLLTREVMTEQLDRVMSREAYTSDHLRWNYNDWKAGLIGMKTFLVSLRSGYDDVWKNTYDDCIRMLEEKGGMPSEVDYEYIQKNEEEERYHWQRRAQQEGHQDKVEEEPVDWNPNLNSY